MLDLSVDFKGFIAHSYALEPHNSGSVKFVYKKNEDYEISSLTKFKDYLKFKFRLRTSDFVSVTSEIFSKGNVVYYAGIIPGLNKGVYCMHNGNKIIASSDFVSDHASKLEQMDKEIVDLYRLIVLTLFVNSRPLADFTLEAWITEDLPDEDKTKNGIKKLLELGILHRVKGTEFLWEDSLEKYKKISKKSYLYNRSIISLPKKIA